MAGSLLRRLGIGRLKDKNRRITKKYQRFLNKFEMKGFMAQKGLMESHQRKGAAG